MIRLGLVIIWLMFLLSIIVALFWYNDWVYRLPTPVPENYRPVPTGTKIDLGEHLTLLDRKPVFLHFYNPTCPCSRFNTDHFRSLVKQYGQDVHFIIVVLSEKAYAPEDIRKKTGIDLPVLSDASIAARCGVYSTPQAVLLDSEQRLYYRGNYNAARYCTEEKTAYAKIALKGLLEGGASADFSATAIESYGCTLPVCRN